MIKFNTPSCHAKAVAGEWEQERQQALQVEDLADVVYGKVVIAE